jgi:hypothetical protein
MKNIAGEIHNDEWCDFGHNRTLALQKAYYKTDYLLVFDADDEIQGDFKIPDDIFKYDAYYFNFGSTNKYQRIQLINNKKKWHYVGVLHEYIACIEANTTHNIEGNYYINSGKFGNRSRDKNKYISDALILENAYNECYEKKDALYNRYAFYCANSYRDANDKVNAIKWYKLTLTLDNWVQEKYVACMNLCDLCESDAERVYYAIESYKYDKQRVECIYILVKYYYLKNDYEIALTFYKLIQDYYNNVFITDNIHNKLFTYLDKLFNIRIIL